MLFLVFLLVHVCFEDNVRSAEGEMQIIEIEPHGVHWSYHGDFGPRHWLSVYPQCGGDAQSPVHIDTTKVFIDRRLTNFKLEGYDSVSGRNMTMSNNGHTVQVNIEGAAPRITEGGLPHAYSAAQFHFHWGKTDNTGSEHALDGKNYPMEMHVVHYADKYGSLGEAVDKPDGLKVLGFFFEIGDENPNFDHLISRLDSIEHKDDDCDVEPFPLRSLMPADLSVYFRYHGSLTTPPCFESVTWTVFKDTIKISKTQMDSFRHKLKENAVGEKEEELTEIYRPVQPLNSRNIYASRLFERPAPTVTPPAIDNVRGSSTQLQSFSLLTLFLFILLQFM